ncbi:hypothetical protein SPRG_05060 [Saprolegnia parasitica CBS 223.65]|uniref:Septum formation inhibitor MinC C-terminal domain-containing protein n=1 Tax=Saprolegnia parasitica (strain CBS 223.65) TaxID=695850 RepID=A0A067CHY4_SAPPC|nr:hypothetical protein SPRG_05060 [Saprolegnia parasitica CBS 223.65]KDO30349.1 hypothetical protein SPRG_05060 [Saprolegnia parasitica CBS 223.65]|eukprot:XP_012198959.1 hypothetical protein SPRG_05060 [Saprolegnia parasitica CBS 223.65]
MVLAQARLQAQKAVAKAGASMTATGIHVLGGAYLIPTLRLHAPVRVNGEYDMRRLVEQSRVNWNLRGPVILDLANVSSNGSPHNSPIRSSELRSLIYALRSENLHPIGITNASEDIKAMAWKSLQVPSIISTRLEDDGDYEASDAMNRVAMHQLMEEAMGHEEAAQAIISERLDTSSAAAEAPAAAPAQRGMMVVEGSVRTGQQVYAKDQGLVVLGSVNSGAEVLADGDIHIYGTLKGRALAGIGGNTDAKVYVQKFDAELISIADTFTTCDALEAREIGHVVDDKPTIVWLEDGALQFKSVVPGP